jgi:hypothetical protein
VKGLSSAETDMEPAGKIEKQVIRKWNINEIYFERAKKLPPRDSRLSQKYLTFVTWIYWPERRKMSSHLDETLNSEIETM